MLAAALLLSCSTLPEYAAPKGRVIDYESVDLSDVISYRTLTRADFKGDRPPPEFAPHADRIGAATCAYILTTPDTQMRVQGVRTSDGAIRYRASPHHLEFFARMDRRCSWWNPKDIGLPEAYVLEHEQIHFALFELEARRLNRSREEIGARLHVTAESPEAAVEAVQRRLEAQIAGRMKDILKRSRRFDEDTSMGHDPKAQKRWWALVQSELAAPGE